MKSVKTIQGDTWDVLALRVYGTEMRAQELMEARENVRLLDYQIFPAGVTVYTPEVTDAPHAEDLPDWRK